MLRLIDTDGTVHVINVFHITRLSFGSGVLTIHCLNGDTVTLIGKAPEVLADSIDAIKALKAEACRRTD